MYEFARQERRAKLARRTLSVDSSQPIVQCKLRVGAVDDPAEREADTVADRVMAALRGTSKSPFAARSVGDHSPASGRIARSARNTTAHDAPVADETSRRIQRMAGHGAPLAQPIRRSMEDAFGADFSGVRLHQGSESSNLNDELSARAFTTGSDIFLGRSVDTASHDGTRLLAHELAHVVQQNGATVRRSAPGDEVIRRAPGGRGAQGGKGTKRAQLSRINESAHWGNPRDKEHRDGIEAIMLADANEAISKKIYAKHNAKDNAIITSFKTSRDGTYVVVGTFADVSQGRLTFDTAYLSKTPAATGVPGKKYYNPEAPIIQLS